MRLTPFAKSLSVLTTILSLFLIAVYLTPAVPVGVNPYNLSHTLSSKVSVFIVLGGGMLTPVVLFLILEVWRPQRK